MSVRINRHVLKSQFPFQQEPTLFRRAVTLPPWIGSASTLRLRHFHEDGFLLYLNGVEVFRFNSYPGPVRSGSLAVTGRNANCSLDVSLAVTNLLPGTNWLACAVVQSAATPSEGFFGLELQGTFLWTPSSVPMEPPATECVLRGEHRGTDLRLSWPTNFSGYALQYRTNLDAHLPWLTSSNQANPFVTPMTEPARFYRLYNFK